MGRGVCAGRGLIGEAGGTVDYWWGQAMAPTRRWLSCCAAWYPAPAAADRATWPLSARLRRRTELSCVSRSDNRTSPKFPPNPRVPPTNTHTCIKDGGFHMNLMPPPLWPQEKPIARTAYPLLLTATTNVAGQKKRKRRANLTAWYQREQHGYGIALHGSPVTAVLGLRSGLVLTSRSQTLKSISSTKSKPKTSKSCWRHLSLSLAHCRVRMVTSFIRGRIHWVHVLSLPYRGVAPYSSVSADETPLRRHTQYDAS